MIKKFEKQFTGTGEVAGFKYRVTEKHPFYKNVEIIEKLNSYECISIECNGDRVIDTLSEIVVMTWLSDEWIEEIEEKEFTKSDMINFANWFFINKIDADEQYTYIQLENWLKKRNENNQRR